ncbi:alpha/beta-hydrolase [Stagonosporopsis vannaccii]|nr:alpha/beta-hydrolase [Stagonosporopsis vannaccii]
MAISKPHIVFLHGAWHSPIYFTKITALLQDQFYVVHAQQLPGVGVPPSWTPPTDLSQDIAAAQSLVDRAIADGNDVIVICHSWGGTVASSALVGYSKKERADKGLKGGVVKVGYMCAFMIDEGSSLHDEFGGEHPPFYDIDGVHLKATDPKVFYNDLPENEQAYWFSQLQTHSLSTLEAHTPGASWKTIPSSYLVCEKDATIPAEYQESMANAARDKGALVDVVRLDAGHSPFLSKPKETVAWIRSVAGEEM